MPLVLGLLCLILLDTALCSYSEDQCSWRGSGLSQESGSVEQISLHCAEGSLEWLYPAGALRLSLFPRLSTGSSSKEKNPRRVTACIKSSSSFRGAQIYVERDGVLELLLSEAAAALQPKVRCFSWLPKEKVALFLQSTLHQDISRRIAAFRYELRGDWNSPFSWPSSNLSTEDAGTCRPCNNTEILMAVCTSDFVIRGNIRSVSNNVDLQESIINVSATRIHRQKFALFQPVGKYGKSAGSIRTLLRCGVKPGPGSFLFTGWLHFGEAWLSCAPRYKDFRQIYEDARQAHENPCEVSLD
ncbi:meteorin isoform X1 [Eublepharis macularius]|uniref:Meteorin isoform X1 n=1 Tax=Eublepharis macularius TaxID=481883 RepID=A0AA97LAE4_EUBMA|nr:meteorin isoform X1 [Eublepharis macularius]